MNATTKSFQVGRWPAWFYNAFPFIYVTAGLVIMAMFGMRNILGQLSGVLLISVGVVAYTIRWMYWKEARIRSEFANRAQGDDTDDNLLVQHNWGKQYESGNSIIDGQHRLLFRLASALLSAVLENKPSDEVSRLLDLLLKDLRHHLHTEEKILAEVHHPISTEHKAVHENLLSHATAIVDKFRGGTLLFGELSEFVTYDLIAQHIATEDKRYFALQPDCDLNMLEVAKSSSASA